MLSNVKQIIRRCFKPLTLPSNLASTKPPLRASPTAPETDESYVYDLTLEYQEANSSTSGNIFLDVPKFNSTLTYLKLGIDGNIKLYTYYDKVDSWEQTFTLFNRDLVWETKCQLRLDVET
ncbi:hypothetical protein GBA52_013709 [Prunus armeniaca]|nr:hypothetical protein GBA52_013709 [Prunus armeniaca]